MRNRLVGNFLAISFSLVLCVFLAGCGEDNPSSPGSSYDTSPGFSRYDAEPSAGSYDSEPYGGVNSGGVIGDDYERDPQYSPGPYGTQAGNESNISGDDYYRAPSKQRNEHDAAYLRLHKSMQRSRIQQESAYEKYRHSDVNYQTGRRQ